MTSLDRARRSPLLLAVVAPLAACSAGSGGSAPALRFTAAQPMMPGFELDTGLQPVDSPAQVQLIARSAGSVTATAVGAAADGELEPVAASGKLALTAELILEVHARLADAGIDYAGQLEDVHIAAPAASASFDPFLLAAGEAVDVTTSLPPGELLTAPLAGVPGGTIVVALTSGAITASFSGSCVRVHDGAAQYRGEVTWTGAAALEATMVAETATGTRTFGPLSLSVPIAAFTTGLDLGVRAVESGAPVSPAVAPCDAAAPPVDAGAAAVDAGVVADAAAAADAAPPSPIVASTFDHGLDGWSVDHRDGPYDRAEWSAVGDPGGSILLDGSDLGNPDATVNAWAYRTVVLPATATRLTFDTRAVTNGALRVLITDVATQSNQVLLDWEVLEGPLWRTRSASLAPWAGRTITVIFAQNDNDIGSGELRYVDNVVIE